MPRKPNDRWTQERFEQLAGLIVSGRSAAQIALELGITRNSVIGKAARSGVQWPPRPMPVHVLPSTQQAWARDLPRFLELIELGRSPRAIAAELERPVEQVRDKAQRMGLKFGHRGRGSFGIGCGADMIPRHDRPRAEPVPPPAPQEASDGHPVHFLERRPGCCAWPLWEPPARIGLVCGAVTSGRGVPYCAEHQATAWTGTASRYARMREKAELSRST